MIKNYLKRKLVNVACWFILDKDKRHCFRHTALCYDAKKVKKLLEYQAEHEEIIYINKSLSSPQRILHYSTYNIQCGIAKFLNACLEGLKDNGYEYNAVVPVKYEYLEDISTIISYLDKIISYAKDFDIIEIQHEYGFWHCSNIYTNINLIRKLNLFADRYQYTNLSFSLVLLDYLVENLLKLGKEIKIVWHSDFGLALNDLKEKNDINVFDFLELPFFRFFSNSHLKIIVMNSKMLNVLKQFGIPTENVMYIQHPVVIAQNSHSRISDFGQNSNGEIIIAGFGFLSKFKGVLEAIKVLECLPNNYKYLHIGGVHPQDKSGFIDELMLYIKECHLESRVMITGFVESYEDIAGYMNSVNLGLYLASSQNAYASGAITAFLQNEVPTITSDAPVFRDLSNHYDCIDICIDVCDSENVANHIMKLVADSVRQEELKRNCRNFCNTNTPSKFISKMYGIEKRGEMCEP